jgi:hypothetical protein
VIASHAQELSILKTSFDRHWHFDGSTLRIDFLVQLNRRIFITPQYSNTARSARLA